MYAWLTKTESGDAMADKNNGKRKGGGIWDIIANYSLVWWGLITGGIILAVVMEELSYR